MLRQPARGERQEYCLTYSPTWTGRTKPGSWKRSDNVPVARSVKRLERALAESGHGDYTIRVLDGTGHGLWEEGAHPPRHRGDFLDCLLGWIRSRTD